MQKLFLLLLLSLFMLTGCVAHNYNQKSYLAPDMPQFSVDDAAMDIAKALSFTYPPGQTTLALAAGDHTFNQALENKLRALGFKIVPEMVGKANGLVLQYKIDRLVEESGCYLTVTLSDGFIYSRIYQLNSKNCIPASALSGRK